MPLSRQNCLYALLNGMDAADVWKFTANTGNDTHYAGSGHDPRLERQLYLADP